MAGMPLGIGQDRSRPGCEVLSHVGTVGEQHETPHLVLDRHRDSGRLRQQGTLEQENQHGSDRTGSD